MILIPYFLPSATAPAQIEKKNGSALSPLIRAKVSPLTDTAEAALISRMAGVPVFELAEATAPPPKTKAAEVPAASAARVNLDVFIFYQGSFEVLTAVAGLETVVAELEAVLRKRRERTRNGSNVIVSWTVPVGILPPF